MFNLFPMCFGSKTTQEEYLPVYTESTLISEQPKLIKIPSTLENPSNLNEPSVLTKTSNEELKFMLEKMNKKINILDKNIRKINKQNMSFKIKKNVYDDNDDATNVIKVNSYLKSYGSTSSSHVKGELVINGNSVTNMNNYGNKMNGGTCQHETTSISLEVKDTIFYGKKIQELLNNK